MSNPVSEVRVTQERGGGGRSNPVSEVRRAPCECTT
jgi:hypothetical protein